MNIRQATLDDVPALARLNMEVQKLHSDAMPHLFKQPTNPEPYATDFRERILPDPDGQVFMAEIDGEAAGYAYAHIMRRPENAYTYAMNFLYIDQIGVTSKHQKSGCGRALIEAVCDMARALGIDRVALDTWGFNTEAHQFFYRMGFKVFILRMDMYLSDGQMERV